MARRRGAKIAIGAAVGAFVVVGGLAAATAAGLLLHDSTRALTLADAVHAFRQSGGSADALAGVYPLATAGTESVDALGGAQHRYPARTGLTVRRVGCGVELRWDGLSTRHTVWTLCASPEGWQLRTSDQTHAFFGQSDRTVYDCGTTPLVPNAAAPGTTWPLRCRSAKDRQLGTVTFVGSDDVAVGGKTIRAAHVRVVGDISGGDSGRDTSDWWFDPATALPVRIELTSRSSRKLLIGRVNYREDAKLLLLSGTPRR
jgi:hypothetical protein